MTQVAYSFVTRYHDYRLLPILSAYLFNPVSTTRVDGPCLADKTLVCVDLYADEVQSVIFAGVVPHYYYTMLSVGCVAQWLERRSLTGELSLASARSVADV